ncbi:MAG: hypothetical protein ACK4GN_00875 [Runella sp.]
MKKLILFVGLLAVLSCKKNALDPTTRCENASKEYENAITAWSQDINNKTKCEAVKKSLSDIIQSCSIYTPAQRKVYEDQIKNIECN